METDIVSCRACGGPNPIGQRFCGGCGGRLPVWCPACGEESPGGKRFCADCGAALPGWCPGCGARVSTLKRFCAECGTSLSALPSEGGDSQWSAGAAVDQSSTSSAAATRDERRLVTALFCDLVGFTPLSERFDAEVVRWVQAEYFQRMSQEIARFGGTVEKYAGDAVLAMFGTPAAREDDAERAVRCALSMQVAMTSVAADVTRRCGVDLALRVGVNTGEAISGVLDAGGRQDYSITGDVVNTAARLQTSAEPGGIMAGMETMRLSRRSVQFGEPQGLVLKGKAGAVIAYPVLGLRERPAERWETERQRTPLIGRDREVGRVVQAWVQARAGRGKLLMLVADAGVGKSRLLAEAAERIAMTGEVRELHGRCLSLRQGVSLCLIADLLRAVFDLRDQDAPALIETQTRATVESLLAGQDRETQEAAIDVLGEVLGLPPASSMVANAGAQARRQTLIKSLRLLFAALSDATPTILVLEDLHWMDLASAEVLAETLADIPALRFLVLVAQRPGWTAPWSEWSWVERLNLQPLEDNDAAALARAVLGNVTLGPELERYVVDRAGGNPFFVEELLLALEETGGLVEVDGHLQLVRGTAERLPSTLTEILLARLDRLDGEVRSLVQMSSVIGRSFQLELLARIAGREATSLERPLGVLQQAEIVFHRLGRQLEYVFKHVTIRDVAYNTLLHKRRQELHARVARAMTSLYPTEEYAEIIAYHYSQTEEHAEAAIWLERAGDRSADMYANQAAISNYEEARKRVDQSGAGEVILARLGEKLGGVFRIVAWYDEALEELEQAVAIYRTLGDLDAEARTVARIGEVHLLRGAREEGIRSVRQTLDRLDGHPDEPSLSPGVVALHVTMVDLLHNGDSFEEALVVAERASQLAQRLHDTPLLVQSELRRGLALHGVGRLDQAQRVLEETMGLAETVGDRGSLAKALIWSGETRLLRGQPRQAREHYERALGVDESRGDVAETAYLLGLLGQVLFVLGDWAGAQDYLERTVDLVRSMSFVYFSAWSLMTLGEHYLLRGERHKATRYLEEPFTIAERSGQIELLPQLQVPLASWDRLEGRPEAALTRLQPLLASPAFRTRGDHRAMQVAARAYLESGADARAGELLRTGWERAREQDNQIALLGWLQVRGMVTERRGDKEQAERAFADALSLASGMPYPYEEAGTLSAWGVMLVRTGHLARGRDKLMQALAIFRRLGAEPDAERVEQALMDCAV